MPVKDDVRIALIGPGAIGERHLASLRAAGARVEVVVGGSLGEAREFAERCAVPTALDDLDEALSRPDIDAVVIASPSHLHAPQSLRALAAGKPVLSEIPCALSLAQAEELANASRSADVPLQIAHTFRFARPYLEIRRRIEDGAFAARHVVGHQLSRRHDNIGWTGRRRDWVDDVLWHHGGHLFDTALWYLDSTEVDVRGTVGPDWPRTGSYMDAAAVLVAPDGDLASLALSYHSRMSFGGLMVVGEEDTFEIRGGALICNGEIILDCGDWDEMMREAQADQDRDFLDAIRENRRPQFTIDDALPSMRVLDRVSAGRHVDPVPHDDGALDAG
ncbi:Gfo/Idh/MocA family protein [Leifsonia sp. NPDC058230]|uniref:Gfo/Idh/MocA family protein n=1 Tax=Leifsonia sp. NPDC058230 TaxID=3346391 RepID=UPI0036D80805